GLVNRSIIQKFERFAIRRTTRDECFFSLGAKWSSVYDEAARLAASLRLLLREFLVLDPVWLRSSIAQALLAVGFVLGVVAFEEHHAAVVLVREDVSSHAVEEPAVVGDHDGRAGEVQQRFFQ